jgi:hypothetical protein
LSITKVKRVQKTKKEKEKEKNHFGRLYKRIKSKDHVSINMRREEKRTVDYRRM